jgi:hypothetical protein
MAASPELEPGASLLRAALDRYESGYSFVSEAHVGDERAIRVEGRYMEGSSQQLITSGDGTIEYLIVGGDQWARSPDQAWEVITTGGASPAPLERLAAPKSVIVTEATATRTELDATYPADRFGLIGDDLVVHIVIRDLLLSSAGYSTGVGDVPATVETRFRPLADTAPITAPPRA